MVSMEWHIEHHGGERVCYDFFCQGEYAIAMYMYLEGERKGSLHYREGSDLRKVRKALKKEFEAFYLEKMDDLHLPFQPYPGRLMDMTLCCYRNEKRTKMKD